MGHVAQSMASGGHPEGAALVTRHDQLAGSLARLQRLAASRQAALMESVCRHEYLAESAELEEWVAEQQAAASSEDYGQDYEHLLLPQAQQQLRAEKEARDDCFQDVLARGQRLLDEERPSSAEIEERCRAAGGVGAADRLALLPERRQK
ncbi:unnamed protein product [Danaus chrysippus]|uniref:(African queen) hypothetical protein n=1 Tax=Danaus chrysippus TaxID=151541 RepID=A0A8J2QW72_9NEOP|nr:unnamed protein product [Danaus chrysippus]